MTFGIGFVHPLYAGVVTDRRISRDSRALSDQYEKAGLVEFSDGRFAYTMTGLVQAPGFDAAKWVAMSLAEAGTGGVEFWKALARFSAICSHRFAMLPNVRTDHLKFSVLFAGYQRTESGSISRMAMVSNFQELSPISGTDIWPRPFERFRLSFQETSPVRCLAVPIGSGGYREDSELAKKLVDRLVSLKMSAAGVVAVLVDIIRQGANEVIGEDCTSIVIPRNFDAEPEASYRPNRASNEFKFPAFVQASHGDKGAGIAMNGATVYGGTVDRMAVVTAPAPTYKRQKCPCGSGSEYRRCHGRLGLSRNTPPVGATIEKFGLDTRELASAAGGAPFEMPSYLFLPGTTRKDYKITNTRTGKVVQDPEIW
ncbi:hypothetical protein GIS00_01075 [Nakamurella sp. YIM 132087]|uniref:SEC-C domain-containing protein n=1 Tax=Nakamurella alba TaxID=2665158 RepID=A0A7K1FEN4_9ACTN|nr:SEC-C domain-containing protein [Nakamurella alba]MTD12536.1 hypothetical protein [Nakamurella alba]